MIVLRQFCGISYHRYFYRRQVLLTNIFAKYCSKSSSVKVAEYQVDLKVSGVSLRSYIQFIEDEYNTLSQSASTSSQSKMARLRPVIDILKQRKILIDNMVALEELLDEKDGELRKMAQEERKILETKVNETDNVLLNALIPINEEDSCSSIVLEVNAGVGGQEAMLFAKELFDMYCNFAEFKGWDVIIADYETTDIGGVRHASALIEGNSAFKFFKYEAGVHRVQRIPTTEKGGRIHTSTASVIALPQPTDIQIEINSKDLKIETKRASGAGGQHVNTTDSAVRILHLPTSISVECQVDRSQIKNKQIAMLKLRALLYQKEVESQMEQTEKTRKSQVRSNYRNEKIRTYNFCQDRISDHRMQGCHIHNIKSFFEGSEALNNLITKLHDLYRMQGLLEHINNVKID